MENITNGAPQIYSLIGKAMAEIGAIGKDSTNTQQGFKYRGIDAVYNTLYPIMAKYGLFITPEIIDHKREERTTTKTYNGQTKTSTLLYSIITVKYTVYAPDGSFVCMTVIGEGMDSGDKATNKAMSIAMKYAMFQLFMIPTEAVDPDGECHEVDPIGQPFNRPKTGANGASVTTAGSVPAPQEKAPETAPVQPETPGAYIKRRIAEFTAKNKDFNFLACRQALIDAKIVEDVPSAIIRMPQAVDLMDAIDKNFFTKAG
jgi:hypothetical protein